MDAHPDWTWLTGYTDVPFQDAFPIVPETIRHEARPGLPLL